MKLNIFQDNYKEKIDKILTDFSKSMKIFNFNTLKKLIGKGYSDFSYTN